jgi:site-specific DNA-methyltransferase (adenine-specific)
MEEVELAGLVKLDLLGLSTVTHLALAERYVNDANSEEIEKTTNLKQWQGWGTALKPAMEPITLARKPLIGTVVQNILEYGTGGLNIDECRVKHNDKLSKMKDDAIMCGTSPGWDRPWKNSKEGRERRQRAADIAIEKANELGRWPANVIHDGGEEVSKLFGEASRFFYTAKASKNEREMGCETLSTKIAGELTDRKDGSKGLQNPRAGAGRTSEGDRKNHHPTVKPIALIRHLIRLITPPNGIILDPFLGSGTTILAALKEHKKSIGIEMEEEYFELAKVRIQKAIDKQLRKGSLGIGKQL